MIRKLELNNFTVFKKASFTFGDKLNIIVGENGSGKTQLLKYLYATSVLYSSIHKKHPGTFSMEPEPQDIKMFLDIFKIDEIHDLVNTGYETEKKKLFLQGPRSGDAGTNIIPRELPTCQGSIIQTRISYNYNGEEHPYDLECNYCNKMYVTNRLRPDDKTITPDAIPQALFIPAREMLTVYPHYQSLSQEFELPYDSTYDNLVTKLGLPYKKQLTREYGEIVEAIEAAIDGKIFLRDEKFYYHPNSAPSGVNYDINMTAEGWRKLGTILQLLRNGSLRSGMVLVWDEPEANLNPKLIRLMAKTILELARLGIQVFCATQSLFLVNELEILLAQQKTTDGVRFFNLRKGKAPQQGDAFSALKNTLLLDEALMQSDRYMAEEV